MANALAGETSPYLLQHSENPVDWRPWGEEARAEAAARDVPLIVSIGYSACHWCHVMERESFEDPGIAAVMNERFVPIKVDREERPDVDALYMEACQAMTGAGGWPLNAFATPDGAPFWAGTYFPPEPRSGLPAWRSVLDAISEAWEQRREEIRGQGEQIAARLSAGAALRQSDEPLDAGLLDGAVEGLRAAYDPRFGGFGGAPKFPPASALELLLARGEREMSLGTLRAMAAGGIHDQLGGGFARYSVDARWVVPHFEKMLYDNALLARAYLHGGLASGDEDLLRVCTGTLDWALREMRGEEGGFHSALDADSEGEEGRFYVWTPDGIREALGDEELAAEAIAFYGVTERGNFEGASVLVCAATEPPARIGEIRERLLAARGGRVRPGLDDKRLSGWNALMIAALAQAGAALDRPEYLAAARECAEFVLERMRDGDGRLLRTYNRGVAKIPAFLDDHAFLAEALLTLYEATWEERWFIAAREAAEAMLARFRDREGGGFFATADDAEALAAPRRKDLEDTPIPSGSSAAAYALLRLAALTGEARYEEPAVEVLRLLAPIAARHPASFGHLLLALDFHLAPVREIAIVGPGPEPLAAVVRGSYRPHAVLAGAGDAAGPGAAVPLLEGRGPVDGRAAAYVCERFACRAPVTAPPELAAALGDA
ncbi:MAG: thioredoxin domain-containing protein [Solirubrobacteraceae bacterium]